MYLYNKRIIKLYNYIMHLYAYNKLYTKCIIIYINLYYYIIYIIIYKISNKLCEILNFK